MKQLIFTILISMLVMSCNKSKTFEPEESSLSYQERIQGFWNGDSLYMPSPSDSTLYASKFDYLYEFKEDTLIKTKYSTTKLKLEFCNDTINCYSVDTQGFLYNYKILSINEKNLTLLGLWNNAIFTFNK